MSSPTLASRRYGRFAWVVVSYTLGVILFGAWVRITGSGAGCGEHWPTCHGQVIPRAPETKTVIEFTHRVTSGLLGPLVVALVIGAVRRGKPALLSASTTALFVVFEALLGAGLVLGELVENDDSVARAVVIALHLVNTLALVGAATLTAFFGGGGAWSKQHSTRHLVVSCMSLTVLLSMTGAVTALGDTLFPVTTGAGDGWFAHLGDDLSPTAHFLVQLRVVHPVLATFGLIALVYVGRRLLGHPHTRRAGALIVGLSLLQVALGVLNIVLGAPGWMQLAHLLGAQLLWIALVLAMAQGD